MKKWAKATTILGWALFGASLWLPAFSVDLLGRRFQLRGWELGLRSLLFTMEDGGTLHDSRMLRFFLGGVSNLLILVSLYVATMARPGRWRWLAHSMLGATILNASLGWSMQGAGVGYYTWVASFATMTIWLYVYPKHEVPNRTMSSNHPLQPPAAGRYEA